MSTGTTPILKPVLRWADSCQFAERLRVTNWESPGEIISCHGLFQPDDLPVYAVLASYFSDRWYTSRLPPAKPLVLMTGDLNHDPSEMSKKIIDAKTTIWLQT
jgi:hypothetical protein